MSHERMSTVDAAWLRMDSDTQRMMITTLLRFEGELDLHAFEKLVHDRVLRNPRFRQRVVESPIPGLGPSWEDDPHFSLASHLHRVALPEPADEATLLELVSDLASSPLDRRAPLWQMHIVENAPGGTSVITRLHHAIGDGVSLIHFLLSLTDECQDIVPATVGLQLGTIPHAFGELAKVVLDHSVTLAKLLAIPTETPTRLVGALGREKRVAFSPPLPVARVKRVAARANGKLNDALLAISAGALRRYLSAHCENVDDLELRALMPVFFRGHGDTEALGNHFGLVFAPLLVGIEDEMVRLAEVKRRMDDLKGASVALVALETLEFMGFAGPTAEGIGMDIFTRKASAMITSIPGPPVGLHLAGQKLADMIVWAPVAGHVGIGISMLSYAGNIRVGVFADTKRMPDPDRLAKAFLEELDVYDAP